MLFIGFTQHTRLAPAAWVKGFLDSLTSTFFKNESFLVKMRAILRQVEQDFIITYLII